jgi:hypothetical protein
MKLKEVPIVPNPDKSEPETVKKVISDRIYKMDRMV